MKCKQRLWMSNLNCGAVCSVSGSLTGSFCCLWSLLPLLFLPFMGTPVFTHTLFFPHLSYLFFLHSTLWTSSTTIFYFHPFSFWSLVFVSLSLPMIPIQAIHTLHILTLPVAHLTAAPFLLPRLLFPQEFLLPFLGHCCFAAAWALQFLTTVCLCTHSLLCGATNKDWGHHVWLLPELCPSISSPHFSSPLSFVSCSHL